jgi:hypothetical protein
VQKKIKKMSICTMLRFCRIRKLLKRRRATPKNTVANYSLEKLRCIMLAQDGDVGVQMGFTRSIFLLRKARVNFITKQTNYRVTFFTLITRTRTRTRPEGTRHTQAGTLKENTLRYKQITRHTLETPEHPLDLLE